MKVEANAIIVEGVEEEETIIREAVIGIDEQRLIEEVMVVKLDKVDEHQTKNSYVCHDCCITRGSKVKIRIRLKPTFIRPEYGECLVLTP